MARPHPGFRQYGAPRLNLQERPQSAAGGAAPQPTPGAISHRRYLMSSPILSTIGLGVA
jgi:hypothetical protein